MASYTKRETKNGTVWDVRFRAMVDGKEKQMHLSVHGTKRDAEAAYKTWEAPVKAPEGASTLFENAFDDYIDARRGELSQGSVYDITHKFSRHILPEFKGRHIGSVGRSDVARWQNALWKETDASGKLLKNGSCVAIRSAFTSFMSWAADIYGIVNPFEGLKAPKRREEKGDAVVWGVADFEAFSKCVESGVMRVLFSVTFWSGCRIGEVLALRPCDFVRDGDGFTLKISRSAAMDRKDFAVTTAPKNSSSNRSVTLPAFLTDSIDAYLETVTGPFVFGGASPFSRCKVSTAFNTAIEAAGVPRITIHGLRHSHASLLISLGVPVSMVSQRLGHKNVNTTLGTYTHVLKETEAAMRDILDKCKERETVPAGGVSVGQVVWSATYDFITAATFDDSGSDYDFLIAF